VGWERRGREVQVGEYCKAARCVHTATSDMQFGIAATHVYKHQQVCYAFDIMAA